MESSVNTPHKKENAECIFFLCLITSHNGMGDSPL